MKRALVGTLLVTSLVTSLLNLIPASIPSSHAGTDDVRGVERSEWHPTDPARWVITGMLYLPKSILGALIAGVSHTAAALSTPEVIARVEHMLYLHKPDLMWYPLVYYTSGFRLLYGAGLRYQRAGLESVLTTLRHDAHYWRLKWRTMYRRHVGRVLWISTLTGVLERRDDQRFYGIGDDPRNDPRNIFISDNDYGTFTEDRRQLRWSTSIYPEDAWGLTYTGLVQRRGFDDSGRGDNDLREVFRLDRIPGFTDGAPVTQLYNELALHIDTRERTRLLSPGWRGEVYAGISNGLDNNKSDLVRAGLDVAAFIPMIKDDRLLVPRLVIDTVDTLDGRSVPFTEYPRQHTFRGTSSRELIRSEKASMVPSLEYQWPLSHTLSGHLFVDYMAVGSSLGNLGWSEGLWAIGAGINLHNRTREIGRLQIAGGTEGVHVSFTLGTPLQSNHRADW